MASGDQGVIVKFKFEFKQVSLQSILCKNKKVESKRPQMDSYPIQSTVAGAFPLKVPSWWAQLSEGADFKLKVSQILYV